MSSWFSLSWLSSSSNPSVSHAQTPAPSLPSASLVRRSLVSQTAPLERRAIVQEPSINSRLTASCTELTETESRIQQFVQISPLVYPKPPAAMDEQVKKERAIRPKTASPVRWREPAGREPSASLGGRLTKSCMELNDINENIQQSAQAAPLLPKWPSPKSRIETSPRDAKAGESAAELESSVSEEESKIGTLSRSQGISIPQKRAHEMPECSFVNKIGPPPGTKRRESATDRTVRMRNYSEFTSYFEAGPTKNQLQISKTSSVKAEQVESSLQSMAQPLSVGSDCTSQSQPIASAAGDALFQKIRVFPGAGTTPPFDSSTVKKSFTLQSALTELGWVSQGVVANVGSSEEDSKQLNSKPPVVHLRPVLTTAIPSDSWNLNSSSTDAKKTLDAIPNVIQKLGADVQSIHEEEAKFLSGLGKPYFKVNQKTSPNETCPDSYEDHMGFEMFGSSEESNEKKPVEKELEDFSESDKENKSWKSSSSTSYDSDWLNNDQPLYPDIGAFLKMADRLKTKKQEGDL